MTDQELEQRLHAWYAAEVGETQAAPDDLRQVLATIPATTPVPLRARGGRRGFTLLAVAAVLIVGGVLAAGSGIINPRPAVTPAPNVAVVVPSGSPSLATPAPTANIQPGDLDRLHSTRRQGPHLLSAATCHARAPDSSWSERTGSGAHEVISDGDTNQAAPVWSPDGTRLLYFDEGKLYLIDPSGGGPQPVDTGCAAPCLGDSQVAFSSDGASLAFIRDSEDPSAHTNLTTVATMDLASGRVVELRSTGSDGSAAPGWSPDGTQIVYFRAGEKDGGGPNPPRLDAIWLVDADGNGLRQLSPTTLAAAYPKWSPDGARILFESIDGEQQDIYTIRPDGTDVRRLTTDGVSVSATWTPDGRILFVRPGGASAGWWTMNADGTDAALLIADAEVGPVAADFSIDGRSDVAAGRWRGPRAAAMEGCDRGRGRTARTDTGPDAGTGAGARLRVDRLDGRPPRAVHSAKSATPLADGRVLFAGGCSTAAELYDPATGTFTPTGDMTAVRGGSPATLLLDGRVLFTGGYNCGPAGQDGIWASAELYDPATGTFSPTGSMGTPREFQTATRLADGRVLIAGGYTAASPSAGTGSPSPRIDWLSPRPACSRQPRCTTLRPARSAGRGR